MSFANYLDQARDKLGTDSKVARAIGKKYRDMWRYRNMGILPDTETCTKLALVLDIEPMEVIACVNLEGAKTEGSRDFWKGFISQHRLAIGAAILLPLSVFLGNADSAIAGGILGITTETAAIIPHYAKGLIVCLAVLTGIKAFGHSFGSSFYPMLCRAFQRLPIHP